MVSINRIVKASVYGFGLLMVAVIAIV